ncbi:histone chaperone [Mycena filopes]|nr:histone chaperone [Mycena filopes]
MSIVTIRNVEFINNPAKFSDVYRFRVTFDCIASLKDDLEWKLIYVSSPGNEELDQELDDCLVGPVPSGGSPPDPSKIPAEDDQEFVRVGYYQNTEYDNEEMKETPPASIMFHRLVRDISAKPRVTRFQIKWRRPPARLPRQAVPSANDLEGLDGGRLCPTTAGKRKSANGAASHIEVVEYH